MNYGRAVATSAMVSSAALSASPIPTVRGFWARRDVGEFPFMPYLAMLMNGLIGLCYGLTTGDLTTCISGTNATLLPLGYVGSYLWFVKEEARSKCIKQLAGVLCIAAVIAVAAQSEAEAGHHLVAAGMCCAGVLSYTGPLVVVRRVIREQRVSGMSFVHCMMNFLCATAWTLHAFSIGDVPLIATNSLGLLAGTTQLSLFALYPRVSSQSEEGVELLQDASDADAGTSTELRSDSEGRWVIHDVMGSNGGLDHTVVKVEKGRNTEG